MSNLGFLLRGIRLGKRLDLPAMAAALATTPDHLRRIESGGPVPPAGQRRAWAAALGFADLTAFDHQWRATDPAWDRVLWAHRDGWVPVVNKAPAGPPVDFEEHGIGDTRTGYEYVPRSAALAGEGRLFAVVIVGDSMAPAYRPGDLVVFRPADVDADPGESLVPDGTPVFVRFTADRDHGCTVKNLFRRPDGRFDLRPENPAHATLVAGPAEIARLAVAVERRPAFCDLGRTVYRVADEHAQSFPDE